MDTLPGGKLFCIYRTPPHSNYFRWLFYIEGALTVFVAVVAIFILPDFPTNTKWLSPEERELALLRMTEDAGVGDESETERGGHMTGIFLAISDWRVWCSSFFNRHKSHSLKFLGVRARVGAYLPSCGSVIQCLLSDPDCYPGLQPHCHSSLVVTIESKRLGALTNILNCSAPPFGVAAVVAFFLALYVDCLANLDSISTISTTGIRIK